MADTQQAQTQVDDYIKAEIQKRFDEMKVNSSQPQTQVTNPPAVQTQEPAPIKFNFRGQDFSFKTPEELSGALDQTIGQYEQKLKETTIAPVVNPDAPDKGNDWNFQTYIDKMGQDPREAQKYMDTLRYGFDPVETLRELKTLVTAQQQSLQQEQSARIAMEFRAAHPEFQGGPEDLQKLDQTLRMLQLPFSPQGLEAAYSVAVVRGMIKPQSQEQVVDYPTTTDMFGNIVRLPQSNVTQMPSRQGPYPIAPPHVNRGNQEGMMSSDILRQANELPLEQLGDLLRQFNGEK